MIWSSISKKTELIVLFILVFMSFGTIKAQKLIEFPDEVEEHYLNEDYSAVLNPALLHLKSLNYPDSLKTGELIRVVYFIIWDDDSRYLEVGQGILKLWEASYPENKAHQLAPDNEKADYLSIKAVDAFKNSNPQTAIKYMRSSIKARIMLSRLDSAIQADAYQFLGRLQKRRFDPAAAASSFMESIRLNELIQRHNSIYYIQLEKSPADLEINTKDPNIKKDLDAALKYYIETRDTSNIDYAYNELGNYHLTQENFSEAVNYFKSSIILKKENDTQGIDVAYNNLSASYAHLNKTDSVLIYMRMAISKTAPEDFRQKALFNSNLGAIYGKMNMTDSALFYFNRALKLLYPNEPVDDISYNPNPATFTPILPQVIANKGNALYELSKNSGNQLYLNSAVQTLKTAIHQFNLLRAESSFENKHVFAKQSRDYYFLALEAASANYKDSNTDENFNLVLDFAQWSKSAIFDDMQRILSSRDSLNLDPQIIAKEDSLNMERSRARQEFYLAKRNPSSEEKTAEINSRLVSLTEEIGDLSVLIEEKYPRYSSFTKTPNKLTVEDIQESINDNEVLLDYTYSARDSMVIIVGISKTRHEVIQVETPKDFAQKVGSFRGLMSLQSRSEFSKFVKYGFDFWSLLVEPMEELLELEGKELIIIPDGPIGWLPFDTFVQDSVIPSRNNYNELPLLIKSHVIRYLNSMQQLLANQKMDSSYRTKIIAFAPFSDQPYEDQFIDLGQLEGSRIEIKGIAKHAAVQGHYNNRATKNQFINKIASYDVIHLATHGLLSAGNPMNNRILFAQNGENSSLPLFEVVNMQINSRMVVLSACDTGTGDLQEGEGIMSLTRGFHNAGTPSLIMSLWPAYDLQSAKIMEVFYKELQQQNSIAQAIRLAKLDYLANSTTAFSHPGYWANYQLSGLDSILEIKKPIPIKLILIIIFGLVVSIFVLVLFRRKTR